MAAGCGQRGVELSQRVRLTARQVCERELSGDRSASEEPAIAVAVTESNETVCIGSKVAVEWTTGQRAGILTRNLAPPSPSICGGCTNYSWGRLLFRGAFWLSRKLLECTLRNLIATRGGLRRFEGHLQPVHPSDPGPLDLRHACSAYPLAAGVPSGLSHGDCLRPSPKQPHSTRFAWPSALV